MAFSAGVYTVNRKKQLLTSARSLRLMDNLISPDGEEKLYYR